MKFVTLLIILVILFTLMKREPTELTTGSAKAQELNKLGKRAMGEIALNRIAHLIIPLRKQPRSWIVKVPIKALEGEYTPVQSDAELPGLLVYSFKTLTRVKDQGDCGSCWAFALADTIIDRKQQKTRLPELSTQYMLECQNPSGCNGGHPEDTALFFLNKRISIPKESEMPYKQSNGGVPMKLCSDWNYANITSVVSITKFTIDTPEVLAQNIRNMKLELNTNGPFYAAMEVYDDFRDYEGLEPYTPRKGAELIGGHAVEIVGYVDNDKRFKKPYWVCKNSWGDKWPIKSELKGFFMIESGRNVCLIESMCGYADASLSLER